MPRGWESVAPQLKEVLRLGAFQLSALDRIPVSEPRGFWNGPADLAVEVLSPDDRYSDMRTKVEQYLARGVALVVVIDPDAETAATFRRSAPSATLHGVELLDLDDVVPGFSCRVEEIFL